MHVSNGHRRRCQRRGQGVGHASPQQDGAAGGRGGGGQEAGWEHGWEVWCVEGSRQMEGREEEWQK